MPSLSFRVVITKFADELYDELVDELAVELDLPTREVEEILEDLPATVARGLDEDDAEDLADLLEELGARVRVVEVASRRRRAARKRDDEEEELEDDEELEEDGDDRPRRGQRETDGPISGQRMMLIAGLCILALLVGMLGITVVGGDALPGCGGDYRGPGANEQLVQAMDQLEARYARGFSRDEEPAHGTLATSTSITLEEDVNGPACYVWIGFSQQGTDLDLYLRDSGQLIAQDRGEDNYPVVRHCVADARTVDVEVQMFGGAGDWIVQRFALTGEPGSDLLTLMHQLYTSMFVVNGQPTGPLKRLHLRAGQEAEINIDFDSEWCYLPLAVSAPGTDLDMILVDPQGREVERDDAVDNYPVLRHCPTKSGRYRLKLLMYGGEGDAVYRIYRGKLGGNVAGRPAGQINVPGSQAAQPNVESTADAGSEASDGDAAIAESGDDGGPSELDGSVSDAGAPPSDDSQPTTNSYKSN